MAGFANHDVVEVWDCYQQWHQYTTGDSYNPGPTSGFSFRLPIPGSALSDPWPAAEVVIEIWNTAGFTQLNGGAISGNVDWTMANDYVYVYPNSALNLVGTIGTQLNFGTVGGIGTAANWQLIMYRRPPVSQDYTGTGALSIQALAAMMDKAYRTSLIALEMARRTIQFRPVETELTSSATYDPFTGLNTHPVYATILPQSSVRANKLLGFDGTGKISYLPNPITAATAAPTPNTLMLRDNNGRAQVVDPVAFLDIANKEYVDGYFNGPGVSSNIDTASPFSTSSGSGVYKILSGATGTPPPWGAITQGDILLYFAWDINSAIQVYYDSQFLGNFAVRRKISTSSWGPWRQAFLPVAATGDLLVGTTDDSGSSKVYAVQNGDSPAIAGYISKNNGGVGNAFFLQDDRGFAGNNNGNVLRVKAWQSGSSTGNLVLVSLYNGTDLTVFQITMAGNMYLLPTGGSVFIGGQPLNGAPLQVTAPTFVKGTTLAKTILTVGTNDSNADLIVYTRVGANSVAASRYGSIGAYENPGTARALVLQELGGNLLIGTTTDDGANKLQVTGATKLTGALTVTGRSIVGGYLDNGIALQVQENVSKATASTNPVLSVGTNDVAADLIFFVRIGGSATAASRFVSIGGYENGAAVARTLVLQELGGNTLIGTTTDDGVNKLQVAGATKVTGALAVTSDVTVSGQVKDSNGLVAVKTKRSTYTGTGATNYSIPITLAVGDCCVWSGEFNFNVVGTFNLKYPAGGTYASFGSYFYNASGSFGSEGQTMTAIQSPPGGVSGGGTLIWGPGLSVALNSAILVNQTIVRIA